MEMKHAEKCPNVVRLDTYYRLLLLPIHFVFRLRRGVFGYIM